MVLAVIAIPLLAGEVIRGDYGVPHVFASSLEGAFRSAGYAVAEDRLWQMELSRRSARGQLAEILGRSAVASDQDALRFGYTDSEYSAMFSALSERTQTILRAYVAGVNDFISYANQSGKLPTSFATKPRDWTVQDSLAISVNLVRRFGRGGAGEIRNLLLLTYLKERLKDKTLDVFQDLIWQNDLSSPTTVSRQDDPHKGQSFFPKLSRETLVKHVSLLPKVNLLELLPGIRLEEQQDQRDLASEIGVVNRFGSYAMVVGKNRSATGVPLLLNGPQMGFSLPSVAHMMSISCPEYNAVGMDVPGIPGVLIGHGPAIAWGLTSGVADTDDIFFVELNPSNSKQYRHGTEWREFEVVRTAIPVKGGEASYGEREMSAWGPVVIKSISTGVAYVRRSSQWLSEIENMDAILRLPALRSISEVKQLTSRVSASFNLFAATTSGDIGWFYCARVPERGAKLDLRLPRPAKTEFEWQGFVRSDSMPYVVNPRDGLILNWNNKPVSWWENGDTPIWGRIFRNEVIVSLLSNNRRVSVQDIEQAVRQIAMVGIEQRYFLDLLISSTTGVSLSNTERTALSYLVNWKGDRVEGSVAPVVYDAWFDAFREELFSPILGNFLAPANFRLVVQPTFVWNAIHRKTKYDYVGKRNLNAISLSAFRKAVQEITSRLGGNVASWDYRPSFISWKDMGSVPYSDRGTYIQLVELWSTPFGRYVLPPGVSENPASKHYADQKELAYGWRYFPMHWQRTSFPSK